MSNLRKEFANLRSQVEDKNKLIVDLEMKSGETKTTHKELQSGVGRNCRGDEEAKFLGLKVNSKGSA